MQRYTLYLTSSLLWRSPCFFLTGTIPGAINRLTKLQSIVLGEASPSSCFHDDGSTPYAGGANPNCKLADNDCTKKNIEDGSDQCKPSSRTVDEVNTTARAACVKLSTCGTGTTPACNSDNGKCVFELNPFAASTTTSGAIEATFGTPNIEGTQGARTAAAVHDTMRTNDARLYMVEHGYVATPRCVSWSLKFI